MAAILAATPGLPGLAHQLPRYLELVDGTDIRDIDRRRSGTVFNIL